jgi:hypothetical protein
MRTRIVSCLLFIISYCHATFDIADKQCHPSSMNDFVKHVLPKLCFNTDKITYLNYSLNDAEFYNAHCQIYDDIKQCLATKLQHCERVRLGFHRHIIHLIESYTLPLEYFDYDKKIFDNNHYLQNLVSFCDRGQLSSRLSCCQIDHISLACMDLVLDHFQQQFDRTMLNCLTRVTLDKHRQCLITFKSNIRMILTMRSSLNEMSKWSEDFLRCIYNSIPMDCSMATKEMFIFKELMAIPEKLSPSMATILNITKIIQQKLPSQHVNEFAQSKRTTTSIHGGQTYIYYRILTVI